MKYNLAFEYRIYPNKEQELLINKTFGCVRFIYNTILYTANKIYEETGKIQFFLLKLIFIQKNHRFYTCD